MEKNNNKEGYPTIVKSKCSNRDGENLKEGKRDNKKCYVSSAKIAYMACHLQ